MADAAPAQTEYMFVVADSAGFVGAFPTLAAAARATARKYPCIPFIVYRFPWAAGARDRVWVVVTRGSDAIAFVSNDRGEAARVKDVYDRVGLAYEDSIDFWEQPAGVAAPPAARRLESQQRALDAHGGSAEDAQRFDAENEARSQAFLAAAPGPEDGPLARLLREVELVTIMDCVVPGPLAETGAAPPAGTGEPPPAETDEAPPLSAQELSEPGPASPEAPGSSEAAEAAETAETGEREAADT